MTYTRSEAILGDPNGKFKLNDLVMRMVLLDVTSCMRQQGWKGYRTEPIQTVAMTPATQCSLPYVTPEP